MKKLFLVLAFLLLVGVARAVDTVNNPTPAQVLSAINSTAAGGTVRIMPENANLTWTSPLTFSKNVTLDLNGATITRNMPTVNGPTISASAVAGGTARVTNGRFSGGFSGTGYNARYLKPGTTANASMRVDHLTFDPCGVVAVDIYHTGGQFLMDHCTLESSDPDEMIHQVGYGPGSLGGWDVDVVEGDPAYNAAYFEDNTFLWKSTAAAGANAAIQNYYGARTVFRHNTLWNALVDMHGDNTKHSGRWLEAYDNDFYCSVNFSQPIQIRGGSAVVFNNRLHNKPGAAGGRIIKMWGEVPGTPPVPCQVGRGKNVTPGSHASQASNPAYFWNNTVIDEGGGTGGFQVSSAGGPAGQAGPAPRTPQDYIDGTAKPGYTPAAYPHPLQGGETPTPTPAPTATPTPAPTPPVMPGLSFRAEDGLISPPFTVNSGLVSQPAMTGVDQGGKAEYQVDIPDAGDYTVEMMVNTPSAGADSFFINWDAKPVDPTSIWDVGVTVGDEMRTVSWRGSSPPDGAQFNPKVWNLNAGLHTLIVRGREGGAQFESIKVIPQVVPTPTPTPTPMPTPTPEPMPTPTPPQPTPTPTPGPTPSPTATPPPSPTPIPTPSPTPVPASGGAHTHSVDDIIGLRELLQNPMANPMAKPTPTPVPVPPGGAHRHSVEDIDGLR
jgi:hypothetical protein